MKLYWPEDAKLKIVNKFLLAAIIICNLYIIAAPLLPALQFQVNKKITKPVNIQINNTESLQAIDRSQNKLIMPSIQLEQIIHIGNNPRDVNKGVWKLPASSNPADGSNTVLVGHRFSYKHPAVFYHLDKVKQNDQLVVVYNQKIYKYTVKETQIVPPNQKQIESPSDQPKLTLYTCDPLWSTKNRLVLEAELVETL